MSEQDKKRKNTAIVLAAGQGKRMGTAVYKQFLHIQGKPVLYYALKCFQESEHIDEIILVTGEADVSYCKKEIVVKYSFHKVVCITPGGNERYESVYQGLKKCQGCDYVIIHDGSRPFVSEAIIQRTLESAKKFRASVAAMPVKDTIKIADEHGFIETTPSRSRVWSIQTPQVFEYRLVQKAYDMMMKNPTDEITDDAMVVETMLGSQVYLAEGSYRNIKITTPEDLEIAELFVKNSW